MHFKKKPDSIFILEEKSESLNEVVIESNQKIKIDRDTTTIKIASFINKTEQTIEDILKKNTWYRSTKRWLYQSTRQRH